MLITPSPHVCHATFSSANQNHGDLIAHTSTRLSILYTRFNLSIKLFLQFCILVPRFCQVVRGTNLPRRKLQSVVGRHVFRRRSRHPSSPSLYPWRLRLRASTLLKASRNWGPELRTALNFRPGFRESEREREIDVVERQDNVLNNPSALPSVRRAMWITRLYNCESRQRPASWRKEEMFVWVLSMCYYCWGSA